MTYLGIQATHLAFKIDRLIDRERERQQIVSCFLRKSMAHDSIDRGPSGCHFISWRLSPSHFISRRPYPYRLISWGGHCLCLDFSLASLLFYKSDNLNSQLNFVLHFCTVPVHCTLLPITINLDLDTSYFFWSFCIWNILDGEGKLIKFCTEVHLYSKI